MQPTTLIEIGGQPLRTLDTGSGAPVVVLHGWGGRIESMAPVIDCLAANFRVLAFDLPGFGESPAPGGVWGTPDYAEHLYDVLTHLSVGQAHFVGHSYGARTSLYLAATHPEIVDKLVLAGASGLKTAPSARMKVKRLLSKGARGAGALGPPGRSLRDAVYRRIASRDYLDAGPLRPILVKVVNEDLGHLLPQIKASTLLIWGTHDDAVPLQHARVMERRIPDAGLVLFEDAGHFAYLEQSERFCRVVRHFFGALDG